MLGDEARIVEASCAWLASHGWNTQLEVEFVDVVADRGGRRVYAEAKGQTKATGLDLDTLYGQLLRRMPADEVGKAVFAVVVPDSAVKAAERVPVRVRDLLGIQIYGVDQRGAVSHAGPGEDQSSELEATLAQTSTPACNMILNKIAGGLQASVKWRLLRSDCGPSEALIGVR